MQVVTSLIHMLSLYLIRLQWRGIPTCEEGKEAHAIPHCFFSCIWKGESLEKLSFLMNVYAFVSHKKAFFKINIQRKSMFHTQSIQNATGCVAFNSSKCISGVSLLKPRGRQQHVLCTHRVHARQTPRPNLNSKLFELKVRSKWNNIAKVVWKRQGVPLSNHFILRIWFGRLKVFCFINTA